MKIVVRVPNWIGDVVFALPALRSLGAHFAGSDIRVAGPPWAAGLLSGTEFAGKTMALHPAGASLRAREAAATLRAEAFDTGILLTNSFSSALLFRRARIKERWGYGTDGRGFLLTRSVRRKKAHSPVHMVRYYLGLLEGLGIPALPASVHLSVPAAAKADAARLLVEAGIDPSRPLVLLAPGAAHGPAKRWPAARFGETAEILRTRIGAAVAVVGTEADAPLAAEIAASMSVPPADLAGRTGLGELLGLFDRAAVLVANDSGPLHMANALRTPVVAVFGPTDPRATGPFHEPARVLMIEGVPCWPCEYRVCPYDHRCMTGIAAAEAARAAGEVLR
jgi:lipopolysaccharide heptosyltransferase II